MTNNELEDEVGTRVVRLHPGSTVSALWLSTPIAYEDTRLGEALIDSLRSWAADYRLAVDETRRWRSAEIARRFAHEGNRLAGLLAEELGHGFDVEVPPLAGSPRRRFRCRMPARNATAAQAFVAAAEGRLGDAGFVRATG
ncbi:hypothetical protein [Agromyces archimandritae]|uniref:Uncharacterized protein n=1 Tax=Agromyces archimandritae TaxID=2781962 RepID=A0A975FNF6_9MICO|nr:hypothetical protein [Agromyces archimandritae]QTX04231.1 hypothetical protein G127AT_13220 [Agromyces archimandritae]